MNFYQYFAARGGSPRAGPNPPPVPPDPPTIVPGFGLGVFSDASAPSDSLKSFNQANIMWNAVQSGGPSSFVWTAVDNALAAADSVGKKCILRMVANWTGFQKASPDWLFDTFGADVWTDFPGTPTPSMRCPVPNDPVYMTHWENFMEVFGPRYDTDDRLLAVQNNGGGRYGEWQFEGLTGVSTAQKAAAIEWHMDIYRQYLPSKAIIGTSNGFSGGTYEASLLNYSVQTLGFWIGNYNGSGTPQAFLRDAINALASETYVFLERENNGNTATLATGFEANMDLHFSQYPNVDMMTINSDSFADAPTKAQLQSLVIDRLRVGGPA